MKLWEGGEFEPRRWQAEAAPLVLGALRQGEPALVVAGTGSGKAYFVGEICRVAALSRPDRVVVVSTSRRSLVRDLHATIIKRLPASRVGVYYSDAKRPAQVTVTCDKSIGALADYLTATGADTSLWIADECHRITTAERWGEVDRLKARARLAVTATPYHNDEASPLLGWPAPLYTYTLEDGYRDGVLVPAIPYEWTGDPDATVDEALIQMIPRYGEGPGICSATSIADAEWYAEQLSAGGIAAAAYHSSLTPKVQAARMASLKSGELRVLVHPSILTEGVDLPWLRWLALRAERPRRELVQEVGRGSRAFPGKTECRILDPLRQLSRIGIKHDANVMLSLDALAEEERRLEVEARANAEREELEKAAAIVRVAQSASSWVARLSIRVRAAGWIDGEQSTAGPWRTRAPTPKQREALAKQARGTQWLPESVREPVRLLLTYPDLLDAGAASDLIGVLAAARRQAGLTATAGGGVPDWTRRWVWDERAVPIEPPTWRTP